MTNQPRFDFTRAMHQLCEDIVYRMPDFAHICMDRVAVCFAQARSRVSHGLQAKLTPMRFERGALQSTIRGQRWTVQRVVIDGREMLYLLTFYLPRFLNHDRREKLITVFHELFHISAEFDGDIRRFEGHYHVHTHSQKAYDAEMERFVEQYLAQRPPAALLEFLNHDFQTLQRRFGAIVGMKIPIPKLLPVDQLDSRCG